MTQSSSPLFIQTNPFFNEEQFNFILGIASFNTQTSILFLLNGIDQLIHHSESTTAFQKKIQAFPLYDICIYIDNTYLSHYQQPISLITDYQTLSPAEVQRLIQNAKHTFIQ